MAEGGMRISGLASGIDPKMVDKLVELEKIPVDTAKKRKEKVVTEKKEFEKLNGALNDLEKVVTGLKTRNQFFKMKVESSHPDIMDGVVNSGNALPGSYEFEVRGLAKSDKELAFGFPDKDKTQVGFGYLEIDREDMDPLELTIEPGATLQDVAQQINDASAGVRAMVVNTKYTPDSFRLLVVSEKSGKEAQINIDPDTTFLEFKEQVSGQNLDVLFEDVPVTDTVNQLGELIDGVVFNIKRSEPGTRVQVNVVYDVDATVAGIKDLIDKYNVISQFANDQSKYNEETKSAGLLGGDGSLRQIMRQLQAPMQAAISSRGKYSTLADIGITTNPKTGTLNMDEAKVKQALTEDYDAVSKLFTQTQGSDGIAAKLGQVIKQLRDPAGGALKSRMRGLDSIIQSQDKDIDRRDRQMKSKEESIRRRFSALESQMSNLNAQSSFLAQKFGGGGGGGEGGGGGG